MEKIIAVFFGSGTGKWNLLFIFKYKRLEIKKE
jgi:hypothetical protein